MFSRKERRFLSLFSAIPIIAILLPLFYSLPVSAAEAMNTPEGFRASRIIDRIVVNDSGQQMGEIDDMIMNRRGKIEKVILSVGPFLGVGHWLVAVSFKALQIPDQGEIVYKVSREQLEKHPVFSFRMDGFRDYYFWPPPPAGGFELGPPGYPGYFPRGHHPGHFSKGRYMGNYGPWGWEYYPERWMVSALLNRHVWNEEGLEVGQIDDLIIDRDGKVKTIILGVEGILEIEEKRVALPFEPLKVSGAGLVYNVSEHQLRELPAYHYAEK